MDENERSVLTPEQEDAIRRIVAEEVEKRLVSLAVYELGQRMASMKQVRRSTAMVEPDFMHPPQYPPPVVTFLVVAMLSIGWLLFYYFIFGGWI